MSPAPLPCCGDATGSREPGRRSSPTPSSFPPRFRPEQRRPGQLSPPCECSNIRWLSRTRPCFLATTL
eukprot:11154808-Lingulodinium_polyedra.AAC.1